MDLRLPGRVPRVSFVPGGRGGIVNQRAYIVQRDISFPHHQPRTVNTVAGGDVAGMGLKDVTTTRSRVGTSSPLNGDRGGQE